MWQKVGAESVSSSHGWFNLINAVIPVSQMAFTAERSTSQVSAWHSSCNSIDTSFHVLLSLVLSFLCGRFDKVPDNNISAAVVSVFMLRILVPQGSAFNAAEGFVPANLTQVKWRTFDGPTLAAALAHESESSYGVWWFGWEKVSAVSCPTLPGFECPV